MSADSTNATSTPMPSILVVDDTRSDLRLLEKLLSNQGYKVRIASDGVLALSLTLTEPPDLILLDIMMPEISGFDICKKLKADEKVRDIPIIFISAKDEILDKIKAFSLGGADYITKPYHWEEVLVRVRTHLSLRDLQKKYQEQNILLRREIQEHKRTAEALALSESRFREIFMGHSIPMILIDPESGRIVAANPAAACFYERPLHELLALKTWNTDQLSPVRICEEMQRPQTCQKNCFIFPHRLNRGEVRIVEVHSSSIRVNNEKMLFAILQDITEKKRTQEELRQAKEALEVANRNLEERVREELEKLQKQQQLLIQRSKLESLGKLAAGMAHEINQPLAGILMGLDNILFKLSSEGMTKEYLINKIDILLGHIERIKYIINHIRIFSRDNSLNPIEKVDVNQVCRDALSITEVQYRNHNVNVVKNFKNDIGFTSGNRYRLEQVILNLLSNAEDAVNEKAKQNYNDSYKKQIKITTSSDKNTIYIEVEDNGIGISENNIDKILDPFFTTKECESGTGLGLSISYGIVREMLGDIKVKSKLGESTTITLHLPKISI